MRCNKRNFSNLGFAVLLLLFLIPNTRGLMQIFLTRIFSFSPGIIEKQKRIHLDSYDWKLQGVHTTTASKTNFDMAKGKVVLLNFWASWCAPCIAEMPSLQSLYDRYKDKVVFIFLTDEADAELAVFRKEKNYNFPIYRSLSKPPKLFAGKSIPRTYVIDTQGEICIDKKGAADWDTKKIHALLDALVQLEVAKSNSS